MFNKICLTIIAIFFLSKCSAFKENKRVLSAINEIEKLINIFDQVKKEEKYPILDYIKKELKTPIHVISPSKITPNNTINILKNIKNLYISHDMISEKQEKYKCLGWANTPINKEKHLIKIIKENKNPIIWAMRGGNGAYDLDELIIKELNNPPEGLITLIGYSDITSLHMLFLFLQKKWKKKCFRLIHGSMLFETISKNKNIDNFKYLIDIINNNKAPKIELTPLNKRAEEQKQIEGKLTGGNTTLCQCTLGTYKQIELIDKILILEDIGERPHAFHRVIDQFKKIIKWKSDYEYVKLFPRIKAIVIGNYLTYEKLQKDLDQIILDDASEIDLPVYGTKDIGHGYNNFPFIYNNNYLIKTVNKQYILSPKNI